MTTKRTGSLPPLGHLLADEIGKVLARVRPSPSCLLVPRPQVCLRQSLELARVERNVDSARLALEKARSVNQSANSSVNLLSVRLSETYLGTPIFLTQHWRSSHNTADVVNTIAAHESSHPIFPLRNDLIQRPGALVDVGTFALFPEIEEGGSVETAGYGRGDWGETRRSVETRRRLKTVGRRVESLLLLVLVLVLLFGFCDRAS
jgi:hypothetical protein